MPSRTSGAEGGPGKRIGSNPDTAPRSDPYIIGKRNLTAIGTLVERATGYTMLLHLPDGYKPEQVRDALAQKIKSLPDSVRHTLTWDQGPEMRDWKTVSVDAGIDIYFCDPHAPWQRGTNENTVACCGSTFRRAATCRCTARTTWTGSLKNSTTAHANDLVSASRSKRSETSCCADRQDPPPLR